MQSMREMELLHVPSRGSALPPPPPLTPTITRMRSDDKDSCCTGSDQELYTDQRQSQFGQHALCAIVTCKSAFLRGCDMLGKVVMTRLETGSV